MKLKVKETEFPTFNGSMKSVFCEPENYDEVIQRLSTECPDVEFNLVNSPVFVDDGKAIETKARKLVKSYKLFDTIDAEDAIQELAEHFKDCNKVYLYKLSITQIKSNDTFVYDDTNPPGWIVRYASVED